MQNIKLNIHFAKYLPFSIMLILVGHTQLNIFDFAFKWMHTFTEQLIHPVDIFIGPYSPQLNLAKAITIPLAFML